MGNAPNKVLAGVGGIDCGAGMKKLIANSIVSGNDIDTNSQAGDRRKYAASARKRSGYCRCVVSAIPRSRISVTI